MVLDLTILYHILQRSCSISIAIHAYRVQHDAVCCINLLISNYLFKTYVARPRAGSGVVRIDPLRFLAGCRTRRLNQLCLSYIFICFIVLLFIRVPCYLLLVFVALFSVFWLFCLSCHYLPSDWLERLL